MKNIKKEGRWAGKRKMKIKSKKRQKKEWINEKRKELWEKERNKKRIK